MKMTKRRANKFLVYLDAHGLLARGTKEQIAQARREYRKLYQRTYRRRYRETHVEVRFTVSMPTKRALEAQSVENGMDVGTYAREATIARLKGPDIPRLRQLNREAL